MSNSAWAASPQLPDTEPHVRPQDRLQDRPQRGRKAFASAGRHSALVRFLRKAIPIGAGAAILIVAFIGIFNPFRSIDGISVGPISLSGTKITMERPKLTGFRKDAQPYEVTATSAAQDIKKPNLVELNELKARIMLDANRSAILAATGGIYDTQGEKLTLHGDVNVKTDTGYQAFLKSAAVDFKAGSVVSREPVRVLMTNGTIDADTLDLSDNGKRIVFEGRVRTLFYDPPPIAAGGPAAKAGENQ